MKKNQHNIVVLASGGIDSTACINFYKKLKFNVEALFIDYGQVASDKEFEAVSSVSEYYKIKLVTVKVLNSKKFKGGLINGRNAFLCFAALINFSKKSGIVALGIHKGTNYYDCSVEFSRQVQKIFDEYSHDTIKIGTPFINFNKADIFEYCRLENVPLHLTYSCELGKKQPCGTCSTCKDLMTIYASKK